MRPIVVTVGPLAAASANNIALTQTPTNTVTLNGSTVVGGVAVLDTSRRVLITTADSTHLFTITGTGRSGLPVSEVVAANGTSVQSALDYVRVTSITLNGTATAALTVGTSGVANSQHARMDDWAPSPVTVQCTATGTVSYTVQQSMDDPNSPTNPTTLAGQTWVSSADTNAVNATGTIMTNFAFAPTYIRVLLNSGTGTVAATVMQSGVAPY